MNSHRSTQCALRGRVRPRLGAGRPRRHRRRRPPHRHRGRAAVRLGPPEGGAPEVNHGPVGTPLRGDRWEGATPDVHPGDVIRVTSGGGVDEVIVDAISIDAISRRPGPVVDAPRLRAGPAAPPRAAAHRRGGANCPLALPFRGRPIVEAAQITGAAPHTRPLRAGSVSAECPPAGAALPRAILDGRAFPRSAPPPCCPLHSTL